MTYIVLARKYRPRSFSEMVGQEHVVQALGNALTQQRLHHAYLFTGTRGVGKTTVSRILAKSLNCTGVDGQSGITASPCGVCEACRAIDAGRFVDYIELDAASNRGVDEISQLLDQAVYKPVVGRFKVYMIDEVHMLTTTAFNAMLKTLEEPPEYLKFVLATTDPQKVPVTVLSRCLQFNLRPMAPQTIQEHLAMVLTQEAVPFEVGALRLMARAARGSMRDALSLTDQAIAYAGGSLQEAVVRNMLGAVDRSHVVRIVEALVRGDGAALVQIADQLRALGLSAAGTLEELALLAQHMAVQQAVPGALDPNDPQTEAIVALAAQLAADETQLLYSVSLHGRNELNLAPDEYSGLVMVLLRLLAFRPESGAAKPAPAPTPTPVPVPSPVVTTPVRAEPVEAPRPATATPASSAPALRQAQGERIAVPSPAAATTTTTTPSSGSSIPPWEELPEEYAAAPVQEAPVRMAPVVQAGPVVPAALASTDAVASGADQERWIAVARSLIARGAVTAMTRELVMQAGCVRIDAQASPPCWVLQVERETLRQNGYRDRLLSAMQASPEVGELGLQIQVGAVSDSVAKRDAADRARKQVEAEQTIQADPLVQNLLARFPQSRIVPGSIRAL
ncbi:MAG: DNA polymerase III subunit gamma/tau [Leptothrix ochracea]|uniref:DNA polymerase III subunit gamma/tau n=1 Tax=Leptothrix ochracea TaxID=735331 RepID=UPI0034E26483